MTRRLREPRLPRKGRRGRWPTSARWLPSPLLLVPAEVIVTHTRHVRVVASRPSGVPSVPVTNQRIGGNDAGDGGSRPAGHGPVTLPVYISLAERSWHTPWSCPRRSSRRSCGRPSGPGRTGIPVRCPRGTRRRSGRRSSTGRTYRPGSGNGCAGADVLPDAPLVILDEPAAAPDATAEHELFARTGELFADRSVLPISHRFATVRSADRICVLNEGSAAGPGAREGLLAAGAACAGLFTLQASRASSASPVGAPRVSQPLCVHDRQAGPVQRRSLRPAAGLRLRGCAVSSPVQWSPPS